MTYFYKLTWIMGKMLFESENDRESFIRRNSEMLSGYDLTKSEVRT